MPDLFNGRKKIAARRFSDRETARKSYFEAEKEEKGVFDQFIESLSELSSALAADDSEDGKKKSAEAARKKEQLRNKHAASREKLARAREDWQKVE